VVYSQQIALQPLSSNVYYNFANRLCNDYKSCNDSQNSYNFTHVRPQPCWLQCCFIQDDESSPGTASLE
ncbi:MAG: hypothetical protein AB8B37_10290, partial [Prochlorococcus sp.]